MDEQQSLRLLKKMAKAKDKIPTVSDNIVAGIDDLGDDLLQNILSRLPAPSFASAASVSRSWNSLCIRILSFPKLSCALSFNPSLQDAVNEVVDKVLMEPIRPHFVMASIGPHFSLKEAFQLIDRKFGSKIPVIVNVAEGIIGRDVVTDHFVQVQWEATEEEDLGVGLEESMKRGIVLTVGFLPGLKVHIVPLMSQNKGYRSLLVDEFVMDIKQAASAVSDSTSPTGIILFTDRKTDINPVLQTIEYAFSDDTFIVGDGGSQFLYRSDSGNSIANSSKSICAAVALVIARDRNKSLGIGETQFHVMLSTGVSPVGATYKAASVKCKRNLTWLTASRETVRGHLGGQAILEEIYDELGDEFHDPYFFVGVTKRRKCSVGKERVKRMQFYEFHDVLGGDDEYLFVNSVGISTGDPIRFYISDSKAALSSCNQVLDSLRNLRLDCECKGNHRSGGVGGCNKREVFGGIVFTCCGRGDTFLGHPGIDSSPFLNNFPGVTFGGTYCAGEICRGNLNLYDQDDEEGDLVHCNRHVYSAVYLVMSYCPPSPPHKI